MMLFKKKYLELIRCGQKTQTIRVWKHRHVRAGQVTYTPGIGRLRVTAIQEVQLEQLTDADAVPDGFASAEALVQEIRSLYAERLGQGYRVFKISFEVATARSEGGEE